MPPSPVSARRVPTANDVARRAPRHRIPCLRPCFGSSRGPARGRSWTGVSGRGGHMPPARHKVPARSIATAHGGVLHLGSAWRRRCIHAVAMASRQERGTLAGRDRVQRAFCTPGSRAPLGWTGACMVSSPSHRCTRVGEVAAGVVVAVAAERQCLYSTLFPVYL